MWNWLKRTIAFLRDVKEIEIATDPPKEVSGAAGSNPLCIHCKHMFRTGDAYICMHPKSRSEWPDLVTGEGNTNVSYLQCNKARHANVLCGPSGKWWEDRKAVASPGEVQHVTQS